MTSDGDEPRWRRRETTVTKFGPMLLIRPSRLLVLIILAGVVTGCVMIRCMT